MAEDSLSLTRFLTGGSILPLISGCKITIEAYEILDSYSHWEQSDTCKKDQISGQSFWLRTTSVETIEEDDHYVLSGPYELNATVGIRTHKKYGAPEKIDIKLAELTMLYKNGEQDKIVVLEIEEGFKKEKHVGVRFKDFIIDIDYDHLEKVEYHVEFTGTYEDGTVREYWFKSYAFPHYRNERYNPHIQQ